MRAHRARGTDSRAPSWAHSVHVEVAGLAPEREYWYRFRAGGATSPVGRTRTAPAAAATPARLRFAFASCQHYEHGYYAAYRHMAPDELDLVVHVGDYIYESVVGPRSRAQATAPTSRTRSTNTATATRCTRATPICRPRTPRSRGSSRGTITRSTTTTRTTARRSSTPPSSSCAARRGLPGLLRAHAAAAALRPRGPDMRLYARVGYGRLVALPRARRPPVPRPPGLPAAGPRRQQRRSATCPERLDPALTMLGATQERGCTRVSAASPARWNVIAQQTLIAPLDREPGDGDSRYWTDGWDGYPRRASGCSTRRRAARARTARDRRRRAHRSGDRPASGFRRSASRRSSRRSSSARRSPRRRRRGRQQFDGSPRIRTCASPAAPTAAICVSRSTPRARPSICGRWRA